MAKEKFLIVAIREIDDCYSAFSETANRAALDAGTADHDNPYSWIEASYSIQLRRWREATHICSFTPSAYYVWLQNVFVGTPNAAWEADADPLGLERESGGEYGDYGTYYDEYPADIVCDTFTVDSVKQLGIRKPAECATLSRRSDKTMEAMDRYSRAIWKAAEEGASEIGANGGFWADRLDVFKFRQFERNQRIADRTRNLGVAPLFQGLPR